MRLRRELVVVVVLLAFVGALARTSAGRFVFPLVALVVVVGMGLLLRKRPAYSRTTFGPRTRILESDAAEPDVTCVECDAPATTVRHYVREWVVLGVPVVLLDDGFNPVCDDHRD
ncbi:hypothetical protein GJR96_04555 [Haloferax sp. MBLA0076]|uniref:DUF8108 domain-containing protein n=1 Tax=Haloferax litoreum TaxID=2666140 RepID=A0A6A8GHM8_9EURY|nr:MULTISPECIES: hypothetical protein [Haloferax]KAB1192750.1 hypothetical protein Hfx1148_04545 [Haloferax sp. CBA1148]MRX21230.1 hypothetical protein [Haloferax litoreum]